MPPNTAPQQLDQNFATGSQALQRGDYAQAESDFRKALALDPTSIVVLNNLAIAVARQQRSEEAIALYKRILTLAPGNQVASRNLGVAYFRVQRYDLALPLLQAFADASPTFQSLDLTGLDLFALGRYEEAAAMLNKASALDPRDLPTLDTLGKAYIRTRNFKGLNDVFQRVMAIDPDSAEAHALMGVADDNLFKEDEALKEFQAALKANPLYPGAHTSMGIVYWRNDNLDAAESEFALELQHYPKDPVANCTMGRIRQRQSRYAEAVIYLDAALTVNPSYRDALLALGQTQLSLNQPQAALDPLRRAIALDDKDAEGHFLLGTALAKVGLTTEGARERQIAGRIRSEKNTSQP